MIFLYILLAWIVVSFPLGILVGKFIDVGMNR